MGGAYTPMPFAASCITHTAPRPTAMLPAISPQPSGNRSRQLSTAFPNRYTRSTYGFLAGPVPPV